MTKQEIQFLENLLQKEDTKGKNSLRKVIWLNTVQPKFKEGDLIIFTENRSYVYGNRISNFIGKIEKVFKWYDGSANSEKKICYGIRFDIEVDGKIETNLYSNTDERLCKIFDGTDTINHITKKDNYQQSITL